VIRQRHKIKRYVVNFRRTLQVADNSDHEMPSLTVTEKFEVLIAATEIA
jgi:hypothetical protein